MKGENTVNADQRQLLYDALLEGTPAELTVQMADLVNKDLDAIEPLIDKMLTAARAGADPIDWTKQDVAFEFYPDGASILVNVDAGVRKFHITIDRSRMRSLGEALIRESGA